MKKILLTYCLLFLAVPTCIQSSWFGFKQNDSPEELTLQALELASMLKEQQPDSLFGNLFDQSSETKVKKQKILSGDQEQELSLADKIKALRKNINKIAHDSLNPIKRFLNATIELLNKTEDPSNPNFATNKDAILKNLQALYKSSFIGLQLNKGLLNSKKPYLKINDAQFNKLNKADKTIVEDIKNILALLWIQCIETYGNEAVEISFPRQGSSEQKLKFSPLRWAYFTSHSGNDFTENQLLNNYSKPCITTMFKQIETTSDALLKKINKATQSAQFNKCNFLGELEPELSNLYQQLMLKKQTKDKYFLLFPEFQDAFPVIERAILGQKPELPIELATTLTKLAEIWLKLINNGILAKEEAFSLSYPEVIDTTTKTVIAIPAATWMHVTACAGYNNWSYNAPYEALVREPSLWESYKAWATSLPEKAQGLFSKLFDWTDSSFDPSIFNN